MARRALRELQELHGRDPTAAQALTARYVAGDGHLVDTWLQLARPGPRGRRTWPDAPSGLRQREVVRGLRLAASRWDTAGQLELPEPLPDLGAEVDLADELGEDLVELLGGRQAAAELLATTGGSTTTAGAT